MMTPVLRWAFWPRTWSWPFLAPPAPAAPAPTVAWNPRAAVQALVREEGELARCYQALGYDPDLEAEVHAVIQDLRDQVVTTVPDFVALHQALAEARALYHGSRGEGRPAVFTHVEYPMAQEGLLAAILDAGEDEALILDLLNQDPVGSPLPFVEVLPFAQGPRMVWRPVADLTLLQKQPRDPTTFVLDVDRLTHLIQGAGLVRSQRARDQVREALIKVRASVTRAHANLPLALRLAEDAIDQWLHRSHLKEAYARKQVLDRLLHEVVSLRHDLHMLSRPPQASPMCNQTLLVRIKAIAEDHAVRYLAAPWMQGPRLADLLLTNLLDATLHSHPATTRRPTTTPVGVLQTVRDEVSSGRYDRGELRRRLRQLEPRGLYVHSLIHALLRDEPGLPTVTVPMGALGPGA